MLKIIYRGIVFVLIFDAFVCLCLYANAFSHSSGQEVNVRVSDSIHKTSAAPEKIQLRKLNKLFTTGDFDGDGKTDTLFEHCFSGNLKQEIDSLASFNMNDWGTIVNWFDEQELNGYVVFNKNGYDTLHLGDGSGLYCLINLGDLNKDGKDEIALSQGMVDWSTLNSCEIYTYCKNKWVNLKTFGVHEYAFVYTSDTIQVFNDIKGFLEKRNYRWYYVDANKDLEGVKNLVPLKLARCK